MAKKTQAPGEEGARYEKEQILTAKRFANRQDLLCALLADDKLYTLEEAEELIKNYLERTVK